MGARQTARAVTCLVLAASAYWCPASAQTTGRDVYVLTYAGVINPGSADYILRGLRLAEAQKAACVVIQLNTPGGVADTTLDLVERIVGCRVPVVVYVSPSGARAFSAGTFLVMAAHVAAMAPMTTIGAAHPVIMGEGEVSEELAKTVIDKATNALAAHMRSIAKKRGRNAEWAELAVRESVAAAEDEALEKGVVDLVAKDLDELLSRIDGRTVQMPTGDETLETKAASRRVLDMTVREKVLSVLAHPNVAYVLFMLALLGIILEVNAPGLGGGGILSAICFILALYGLAVLDVNYAGVALIVLSVAFFILEIKVPSHGLLTIGGVVSLALGSLMLFQVPNVPAVFSLGISTPLIVAAVACVSAFFIFCVYFAVRGHRRRVVTGQEALVGMIGVARSDIREQGRVFADSTLWTAESVGGIIPAGAKVEIVAVDGLRLKVRPYRESAVGSE